MDTKIVYQTDHLGIFTGETIADRSPLELDVWLIPGGCVEVAPPAVPEKKAAFWDGRRWQLVDSYQGLTAYNIETRAALVIERAGALPIGYTLEVPGPGQIWSNGHWIDDIPAVIELRYMAQLSAVNLACLQEITGGFWSVALGDRFFYETQLEDQLNLTSMILRGLDGAYACRDEAGMKAFLDHSAEQLRQIGDEFTEFKLQRLRKANELKQALAAARSASDLDAINAAVWESTPV
ncbi:phage tail protein [Pseudomonas frederiksbergensis]|uniref:DUF4376 domain-containing protein n=1 Tax=Pseudomonas frederiksbergensis TaxID=104087 RepID=UPI00197DC469|nr:phage tail protein [Pseudomonas frederiksbergensis]MBN3864660.1 phage tail protein [Pseudomonas frederiksbergensis]